MTGMMEMTAMGSRRKYTWETRDSGKTCCRNSIHFWIYGLLPTLSLNANKN